MNHIYIFPNATSVENKEDKIKLNISEDKNVLTFFYNDDKVTIDIRNLDDESSTLVMHNTVKHTTYALYNFREILQVLDMTPYEFLHHYHIPSYMQIDKVDDNTFIKVFLPKNVYELDSDTTNFYIYPHYNNKDKIHELDLEYSYDAKLINYRHKADSIILDISFTKSDFYKNKDIYLNYSGTYKKLQKGLHAYKFKYIEGNDEFFVGLKNSRYIGRAIKI